MMEVSVGSQEDTKVLNELPESVIGKVRGEGPQTRNEVGGDAGKDNPHLGLGDIDRQPGNPVNAREELAEDTPRGEDIRTGKGEVIAIGNPGAEAWNQ